MSERMEELYGDRFSKERDPTWQAALDSLPQPTLQEGLLLAALEARDEARELLVSLGNWLGAGPGSHEWTNADDMNERIRAGVGYQTAGLEEWVRRVTAERDQLRGEVERLRKLLREVMQSQEEMPLGLLERVRNEMA